MTHAIEPREATTATVALHTAALAELPLSDRQAYADATRGFVGSIDPPVVRDENGRAVWDLTPYTFLGEETPATVHPSLWRMAQLNQYHGLFEVTDRIYQVRGLDVANMTIVEGDEGFIIIDPLTCVETAAEALRLARAHLGERPVTAVIITHSHTDHFGGVKAVVDEADVRAGRVPLVAPTGFYEHAVSENIYAGVAMNRRLQFMTAPYLPRGPRGEVSISLGLTLPSGTSTLIEPSHVIGTTGTEMVLDGVRFVFQFTPGAEAPAEMNFYLPDQRALCMAETISQQMHNLYTPRGAQVRDALAWSGFLDEAIRLFGDSYDVMFISHQWPTWGRDRVTELIGMHRDLYRYIHDETLRLANHGYTPIEIAEMIELPEQLAGFWPNRGVYGTVSHNVKAVYQRYLGWFDGNPANLHPVPPAEAGRRYVELAGGQEELLTRARAAFEAGECRWAAELGKHLIAADPGHQRSRDLQADILEQLGYQSESGPWRNFYLVGADELRNGIRRGKVHNSGSAEVAAGIATEAILSYLAIRLDGSRAAREKLTVTVALHVADSGERWDLRVANGVLNYGSAGDDGSSDVRLRVDRRGLVALLHGDLDTLGDLERNGSAQVEGDADRLRRLFGCLDSFRGWFDIVTPNALPVTS